MNYFNHIKLLLLLIIICQPASAQLLLRGQAPLVPGNYWKYYISEDGITVADSFSYLVRDSIINISGNEYYLVESWSNNHSNYRYLGLRADSFYIRFDEEAEDSIYKFYKSGCQIGDQWSQIIFYVNTTFTVIDTVPIYAWGKIYPAKEIHLTNENGFISMYFTWSDSLGLMTESSDGQYIAGLAGCVINGKVFGDTTMFITSITSEIEKSKDYKLYQNYPNPFNPQTTITYYLPFSANVKIKIFNILSEEIVSLADEYEASGNHSIDFDATGLSSGVYIYRIEATSLGRGFTDSKPMVLIK